MSPWAAVAMAGIGVAIAPWLRVEAFRNSVPAGLPRRSSCPHCDARVTWPGTSWTTACRGVCRSCGRRIGPPAVVVELAAAATFACLASRADAVLPLLAYCFVGALGIVLTIVDIAVHRLPNRLTFPLATGAAVILAVQSLMTESTAQLLEAIAAGFGAMLSYVLMWALTAGGVGLGDAKLALGIGVTVGWAGPIQVILAMILGLVFTGAAAIMLVILRRASSRDSIPNGPFMLLAGFIVLTVVPTA